MTARHRSIGTLFIGVFSIAGAPSTMPWLEPGGRVRLLAQGAVQDLPSAEVFRIDPGVVAPRVLRQVAPRYTAEAMRTRIQGPVQLDGIVETDGVIRTVRVARSLD